MSTGPGGKFLDLWRQRVSPVGASLLTLMWVLLWGDLSWGNVVAGLALALTILLLAPMPHGPQRRLTIRPIALARACTGAFSARVAHSVERLENRLGAR